MPMRKGSTTNTVEKVRQQIKERCSAHPMSCADLAEEFGYSYKAMWTHIKYLQGINELKLAGKIGQREVFVSDAPTIIPMIPGPVDPITLTSIALTIYEHKGQYKPRLDLLLERWPQVLTGILRTAVIIQQEDTFPAERHEEYRKYLQHLRDELALRLKQITVLLQTDKFWTEEGLAEFPKDPKFKPQVILDAFSMASTRLNEIQTAEKKVN